MISQIPLTFFFLNNPLKDVACMKINFSLVNVRFSQKYKIVKYFHETWSYKILHSNSSLLNDTNPTKIPARNFPPTLLLQSW